MSSNCLDQVKFTDNRIKRVQVMTWLTSKHIFLAHSSSYNAHGITLALEIHPRFWLNCGDFIDQSHQ